MLLFSELWWLSKVNLPIIIFELWHIFFKELMIGCWGSLFLTSLTVQRSDKIKQSKLNLKKNAITICSVIVVIHSSCINTGLTSKININGQWWVCDRAWVCVLLDQVCISMNMQCSKYISISSIDVCNTRFDQLFAHNFWLKKIMCEITHSGNPHTTNNHTISFILLL